jgi:hypothetical protein
VACPHKGVSEVANDIDDRLINFWRTLQDPGKFEAFRRRVEAIPLARAEWEAAHNHTYGTDPIADAVAFFVDCRQSRAGQMANFTPVTRSRTRRNMNGNVSEWLTAVDGLPEIHARLRRVIVENMPALDLIKREDREGTLFYCLHPSTPIRTADERMVPVSEVNVSVRLAHGKQVLGVFERWHDGDILSLRIRGLPDALQVTPEHRVVRIPKRIHKRQDRRSNEQLWAAREVVEAGSLRLGDYLLLPTGGAESPVEWSWVNESRKQGIRRQDVAFSDCPELYRFLGYYASEGHIQRTGGHASGVLLSFCIDERETWVVDAVACCQAAFRLTPGPALHRPPIFFAAG